MSDLVAEALEEYERHPEPYPVKEQPKAEDEGEQQEAEEGKQEEQIKDDENELALSEDSELTDDYEAQEDFRQCGEKITDLLKEGLEIPDEVYVQLYIAKIRLSYPHKTKA